MPFFVLALRDAMIAILQASFQAPNLMLERRDICPVFVLTYLVDVPGLLMMVSCVGHSGTMYFGLLDVVAVV